MTTGFESQPEDVIATECVAVRLRTVNRVITKIYDDVLRPFGVKTSQLNILVNVGRLGVARPAVMCERLQLDSSTLSRNVERMIAKGWLESVADDDGRAQPFQLTADGRTLVSQVLPAWEEAQAATVELIGSDVIALIDTAVQRIHTSRSSG